MNRSTDHLAREISLFKESNRRCQTYICAGIICNKMLIVTCVSADRNPEEKVLVIKNIFSDFAKKFNTPDPVAPSVDVKSIDRLIHDIMASGMIT